MPGNLTAKATITIHADKNAVWNALTRPEQISKYMFGARVESDWRVLSPITWTGELNGKKYEDKGEILDFTPEETLAYSHYSSLSGKPDKPENYHTVSIHIVEGAGGTVATLTQDNNPTEDARTHSQEHWTMMLQGLKKVVEG
ncbi:MAG: SRPBCC domain-containing protein [Rhodanobacter sp.]